MSHQESKSVSQNFMGIAITTRHLQFPGFGDLQGTIKIFPVLRKPAWPLCTFIGHRGAENKIPPPNNTDRQHEFVLQLLSYLTYFLLLPDSFKCHLLARCLWKCRQLLSSFVFPLGTTTTAMSKVGQNRMISPKQFKVLWAVLQAQKHFL